MTVDGSSFTANTATDLGGALNLAYLETVDVRHATFCANHSDGDGEEGANAQFEGFNEV